MSFSFPPEAEFASLERAVPADTDAVPEPSASIYPLW